MRIAALFTAAVLALASLAEAQNLRDLQRRYGEHLAQECFSCHRRDGRDVGIPGIVGLDEEEFVDAMALYRTGRRVNQTMASVTASLTDEQIRALAIYLSGVPLPPDAPRPPAKAK